MGERITEHSDSDNNKRVNLYLNIERYNRLEKIGVDQGMKPAEVVRRFMALGLRVWDEAQVPDFEGIYIKKGGKFIKLPFIL